jgi:hypothetical protein
MKTYQTPPQVRQAMQQAGMRAAKMTRQFNAAANSGSVARRAQEVASTPPANTPDIKKLLTQL